MLSDFGATRPYRNNSIQMVTIMTVHNIAQTVLTIFPVIVSDVTIYYAQMLSIPGANRSVKNRQVTTAYLY